MTDPVARTRELLAAATAERAASTGRGLGFFHAAAPTLLAELADACEAKDAEIERLLRVHDTLFRHLIEHDALRAEVERLRAAITLTLDTMHPQGYLQSGAVKALREATDERGEG